MPFLNYVCKNPTPHKTQVFVPAAAMGSASPGASGGNQGAIGGAGVGGLAIITCPKCAFTAQAADGAMSSVSNGLGGAAGAGMNQESAIGNSNEAATDQGVLQAPVLAGTADSAVRIPIGSPGNMAGGNQQAAGTSINRLDSAGQKNLL